MIANSLTPKTDGRNGGRSNVFVIATLYSQGGSAPVRIRNLSPRGALIEGAVLPLPGAPMRLSRGSLHVTGEVVWSADGRSGLRFHSSISVADWLPRSSGARAQHDVDEFVFKAKLGSLAGHEAPAPAAPAKSGDLPLELGRLATGLTRLCNELADDGHVAAHFAKTLQIIEDTARQLDRLAGAVLKP